MERNASFSFSFCFHSNDHPCSCAARSCQKSAAAREARKQQQHPRSVTNWNDKSFWYMQSHYTLIVAFELRRRPSLLFSSAPTLIWEDCDICEINQHQVGVDCGVEQSVSSLISFFQTLLLSLILFFFFFFFFISSAQLVTRSVQIAMIKIARWIIYFAPIFIFACTVCQFKAKPSQAKLSQTS